MNHSNTEIKTCINCKKLNPYKAIYCCYCGKKFDEVLDHIRNMNHIYTNLQDGYWSISIEKQKETIEIGVFKGSLVEVLAYVAKLEGNESTISVKKLNFQLITQNNPLPKGGIAIKLDKNAKLDCIGSLCGEIVQKIVDTNGISNIKVEGGKSPSTFIIKSI